MRRLQGSVSIRGSQKFVMESLESEYGLGQKSLPEKGEKKTPKTTNHHYCHEKWKLENIWA